MFVQPFYFVSYYVYWIEYDDYIFIFIFRRPIIIGWRRDTGTIFWPIRNSIRICGWRLDRQVDLIKIGFTGSLTLRSTTCGRPVVFQLLGAPNQISSSQSKEFVALQQCTTQLTERYDHLSAEYAQLKTSHAQQRAESAQQKAAYEQLREVVMNIAAQSGTCAPNPFWPYNHQPPPPGSPPPTPAPPLY